MMAAVTGGSTAPLRTTVDRLLAPWRDALGGDREAYENHVYRVLALCDALADQRGLRPDADTRLSWLVAGAFHDLGMWSARTWDYLDPSTHLARTWLAANGRDDIVPVVERMIREHHGVRARGAPEDPVEIFRRADVIDVWLGTRRYGLGRRRYRELMRSYPDSGFHRHLAGRFIRNVGKSPLKPLPMFRW